MCLGTLYVIDAWVNWGFSFFDKFALVFNSGPESLASFTIKTGAIEVTLQHFAKLVLWKM